MINLLGVRIAGSVNMVIGALFALVIALLAIVPIFLLMVSSTADASRALPGLAKDDATVRQLGLLTRRSVPAIALCVDCVINIAIVMYVSSPLGILLASNLGYILAIVLAHAGSPCCARTGLPGPGPSASAASGSRSRPPCSSSTWSCWLRVAG